ncbi:MAG: sodium:solute symporter family protein, partial [Acidobacteriia bacterium]|nr:sodium:solute symporter family protein [Terriglobia bacterium]
MGPLDLGVVAAYLAATVWLGVRGARRAADRTDDYLLAGRTLSLPAFVVALVATWYGGVLGVGEYSYLHGLSNWLVMGVPYYVGALLFAALFARKARMAAGYTVPDLLFDTYGRGAGIVGTVTVLALSLPAAYLLMLGVLLRRVTGWDQRFAVVASALFCFSYIAARGFRSVVRTKGLQFGLMYGGFLLLLPVAVWTAGGWSFLHQSLPAEHFTWDGAQGAGYVAAWYFIALETLVEPTFYQRSFAARSPRTARNGILVSILFFALFDGLTTFTGMYARALLPGLPSGVDAFPALGERLLPAVLLGVFYAGMVATVMATVDSFLLVGGVTLGRDLVWRLSGGKADQIFWTRAGLCVATAASAGIALASRSVVALWYGFYSVGTATLLPPLLGALYPRLRPARRFAGWGMVVSGALTLAWLLRE